MVNYISNTRLNYKSIIKTTLVSVCVATLCIFIIIFPNYSSDGVRIGLSFCSNTLIPSLFPFMVLSAFIVKSGLANKLGTILEPITKCLFNLPGCTGATILISLIGGYPSGARGVKSLVEKRLITEKQAEQLLCFTVGAGPAFVITVVGNGLMKNNQSGIILFLSQIIAAIISGIISKRLSNNQTISQTLPTQSKKLNSLSSALVDSCLDSTEGMINMCAFVVLFSSILSIAKQSGISEAFTQLLLNIGVSSSCANSIMSIILEVTNGCSDAARYGASPELIAFGLGWAGACVHFQICSSLTNIRFSKVKFTLFRFIHGALAAIVSHIIFLFFPQTSTVFLSNSRPISSGTSCSPIGCIALLILCSSFLISCFSKNTNQG